MRHTARTATCVAVLLFASACSRSAEPSAATADGEPRIRLNLGPSAFGTIDVVGLPADDLSRLEHARPTPDQWTALLRIEVASDDRPSSSRPAVLGVYTVSEGGLHFAPQFPFDPGQRYHVVLDRSLLPSARGRSASAGLPQIKATIQVTVPDRSATTRVVEVYPTAQEVPENQLRLYISFSAPMGLVGGSAYVHLLDEGGLAVADPFLPLDLDLWNKNRTRYTVLFDPGRVKRGILPNEEMGRSLIAGRKYTLVVDHDWRDATGQPLAAPFRREFRVGPAEDRAIDPAEWRLDVPREGSRDPLTVSFPKPLDYGLLQRALRVASGKRERLEGEIHVQRAETLWLFTPRDVWQRGEYRLVAASILEDVAGNRIGRPFEVAFVNGRGAQVTGAAVPFRIPASKVRP
jgi:hypothetical protein